MGPPVTAAVAPTRGSSVYFALGSPREDGDMRGAHAWVKSILADAHDASVAGGPALSYLALFNQLLLLHDHQPPLELTVDAKMTASHYLGGHTLVLVMHRLPVGSSHGAGLLIYGHHGLLASDVVLSVGGLAMMSTDAGGAIIATPAPTTFADPIFHLVVLLNTIRSSCDNLYLTGVGPGASIEPLATRLKALLGIKVFVNTGRLQFLSPIDRARVLTADEKDTATGIPFDGIGKVDLISDDFFRGAEVVL
jgi:hypothetical protein